MAIHSLHDRVPSRTERSAAAWSRFISAQTEGSFFQSWLAILCEELESIHCAALLLHIEKTNSFSPVAVWPDATDLSHLNAAAERALADRAGVIVPAADSPRGPEQHIAYPVLRQSEIVGIVVLATRRRSEDDNQLLMRRLHWGIGWLQTTLASTKSAVLERRLEHMGVLTETVASVLRDIPLQQALYDAANQIARHLGCSRVAVGLARESRVRVTAFSDAAGLEKNTDAHSLYKGAMEEALDSQSTVCFDAQKQLDSSSAHAELAHAFGAKHVVSTPLLLGAVCVGVVTGERHNPAPLDNSQLEWLQAASTMLAGVIYQKQAAERGYFERLRLDTARALKAALGPRYLSWKLVAGFAAILLTTLFVVHIDYRVRAKTVIEGEVQRTAAAPFQGYVAASFVRAGDVVRQGQVLCVMDDRQLRLERDKWASEREQHQQELREAMAEHDLTRTQIVGAQVQQSEAQLALVNDQLAHSRIVAPFDGVVISGDLSQLIGSPVELGKKLFEIAPLHDYRVILQVDESEIRHVHEKQRGYLVVTGIASDPLPLVVTKMTPVSTAKDGANYFRVEASLDHAPANLRPGMEGIGKIEVGERRLWWVATHTLTDWIELKLWQWLP
jgi:multidrug efflux pump subunit AcrA (membrane-fusion protein)